MKKLAFITTLITLSSTPAFATQIKVVKSTGQKAIVEFPKGTTPKAGETFTLSSGGDLGDESGSGGGGGEGSRKNYIDLGSNFSLSSGTLSMAPILNVDFGWNTGSMEFGLGATLAKMASIDFGFGVNGRFEFNFTENKPGAFFVPALTLKGSFSHGATDAAASAAAQVAAALAASLGGTVTSSASNTIGFSGGLAAKIFALRASSTAIRLEALFNFTKTGSASSTSFTLFGAGLETYF